MAREESMKVMKPVENPTILQALASALIAQYGVKAYVSKWFHEKSVHGDTYKGFEWSTCRWITVGIDSTL